MKKSVKVKIIGRDWVNWSIDKDRKNLCSFLSDLKGVKLSSSYIFSDIYFFVWYEQVFSLKFFFVRLLKKFFHKKIVAVITNDCRDDINKINHFKGLVDLFIAPSQAVSDFLTANNWPNIKIPFYVSPAEFYRLSLTKLALCERLKIDYSLVKDKILIGSFQRDSLGKNLLLPKWQKNPDLLVKILSGLPREKFILILAGPRRHYLVKECERQSIPYIFVGESQCFAAGKDDVLVNNLSIEKINWLYNLIDLYLVTSASEGGPKAILESSLCQTMIFSTPVGLAPDFLHPFSLFDSGDYSKISEYILNCFDGKMKQTEYIKYNFEKVLSVMENNHYQDLIINIFFKLNIIL